MPIAVRLVLQSGVRCDVQQTAWNVRWPFRPGGRGVAACGRRRAGAADPTRGYLIGDLTAFENVELPLTYLGLSPAERRARVNEVLARVEMRGRAELFDGRIVTRHDSG
jgi:ABC-type taurine transport system ATPase subunit